ncbi:beta-defensin 110 [Pteronotus mesoamericanus]|uniref:beta-defensin 110 n=1 Tax=Pteronotus mesoamericanus TaxID=1884717 RepID=UPI0023EBB01D|nr:beta-defensin 110 [Pteronotus parnellii mesoamericanus]
MLLWTRQTADLPQCLETGARSNFEPKYRFERCEGVKGICKPFCDDDEYDYGYCIKWRNQCCI